MKTTDSLKGHDKVTVSIWSPEGSRLYQTTNTGFHSIEDAIKEAVKNADIDVNPEDCVFEVTNQTTAVSHRYRLNAHGNVKLIV